MMLSRVAENLYWLGRWTERAENTARVVSVNANLLMDLPITALEAYRGGPIDVPTPTSTVTIKLAPGSQNGQVLRLKGKGVSMGGKTGDLLITLDLRMPAAGSEKLLEVLEELQAGEDPRAGLTI